MASPFGDPPPGIDLYDSHTARKNAVTISLAALDTVAGGVGLGRESQGAEDSPRGRRLVYCRGAGSDIRNF